MREGIIVLGLPLAAYYVSWLIVHAKITSKWVGRWQVFWESRWERRHPDAEDSEEWQSKLAYLPSCIWCAGFWVSGIMLGVTALFQPIPLFGILWLAMAAVIGLLDSLVHRKA
jgi:hypothetical protein